jgi:putative ABC transport system permease protein
MKKMRLIIRRFLGQKMASAMVLISFTIAFGCAILVYLFAKDEFSFDKHNPNYNRICRLLIQSKDKSNISSNFSGAFYNKLTAIPGIKKAARLQAYQGERFVAINNTIYTETCFLFADPDILDILKFDFILGNPKEALAKPFNVIVTESVARKYFGNQNPMGKVINEDHHDFTITGVIKDLPRQSHLSVNFLASVSSYQTINPQMLSQWYISSFSYYFLIPENADKKVIENQLTKNFADGNGIPKNKIEFTLALEPLGNIHLKSVNTTWDNAIKGDIKIVNGLIVIALLILVIAIANYVNILTAHFRQKIKERSIRKINGAPKYSTLTDQLGETLCLLSLAMILANIFAKSILPFINGLTGKALVIHPTVFVFEAILLVLATLLSVLYPVVFINSFKTQETLKNQFSLLHISKQKGQQWLRGSLITIQLSIAMLLLIAVTTIYKQLNLVMKAKVGFDKENVLIIGNPYTEGMDKRYDLFREKLKTLPGINGVGVSQNSPGNYINNYSPAWLPLKPDQKINIGQITVDKDYLRVIGAEFVTGHNFDLPSEYKTGIVINQTAMQELGLSNPAGSRIVVQNNALTPNNELEIIGVIKDMQYFTLKETARPVMYYIRDWGKVNITLKLAKGDYSTTLAQVKKIWKEIEPSWPMNFQFMDQQIQNNYKAEISTSKIISGLAGIAILLSVLGMLGLITYTIQHRTKEIGIRKVNGARVTEILTMLNKDFIKWVAIAFIISCPISWYAMHQWLQNFAYKTELSWWVFALAGLLAMAIALLTVSWQSWRAATRNPVESLRYE